MLQITIDHIDEFLFHKFINYIIYILKVIMEGENQILICSKHEKYQKNLAVIPNNYYICLNRYCPNSCTIICSQCKQDHRDHIVKLLSIQDICFLIDRLLKTPFKQASNYMVQTIDVMQKLQLIRQFKKKIDKLEQQIQKETISLVEMTQNLIGEYAQCKNAANETADLLFDIENYQTLKEAVNIRIQALTRIDYNFQKDKFEYGGLEVKEKQEMRRKMNLNLKRKIQEVKEYSMKIIEVILNSEESEEEEEDLILKKKIYENLKAELFSIQKENRQKQQQTFSTKGNTNTQLSECSMKQHSVKSVQTDQYYEIQIKQLEDKLTESERKISIIEKQMEKQSKQAAKQKQSTNKLLKEKDRQIKQFQLKVELLSHFEEKLRENYKRRLEREHDRERTIQTIMELVEQETNGRSGKRSASKDPKESNTRDKSKSPKKNENLLSLKPRK